MKPEMSAFEIRNKTIKELNSKIYDFICLNFANLSLAIVKSQK